MAEWVSHLIVADRVLEILPWLKKHEFCVGNIAPDCNIPNEDWSEFTSSREITHWMKSERKKADDCSVFRDEYILKRIDEIRSEKELSFLLGYYAHLITDAEQQRTIRDEKRVAAAWKRAKAFDELREQSSGMEETWDNFKKLFPDAFPEALHQILLLPDSTENLFDLCFREHFSQRIRGIRRQRSTVREYADTDPEEFFQVRLIDHQELKPFKQRYIRIGCFQQNALIEGKPAQLAVDEHAVGLGVVQIIGIRFELGSRGGLFLFIPDLILLFCFIPDFLFAIGLVHEIFIPDFFFFG